MFTKASKLNFFSLFFLGLTILSGCSSYPEDHGYVMHEDSLNKIIVGQTDKEEVRKLLGSPSTKSDFGPEKWTYIGKKATAVAFFEPKVTGQEVTSIEFGPDDKVVKIQKFGLKDVKNIEVVKDKTPTEGNKLSLIEQLLGNLGRFNSETRRPPTTMP